jgi:hypothetical protein
MTTSDGMELDAYQMSADSLADFPRYHVCDVF